MDSKTVVQNALRARERKAVNAVQADGSGDNAFFRHGVELLREAGDLVHKARIQFIKSQTQKGDAAVERLNKFAQFWQQVIWPIK